MTFNGSVDMGCRQWENVYFMHLTEGSLSEGIFIKGTLFLTEHESKVSIHWVPDPDQDSSLAEEYRKGYEIDVKDLEYLVCRRAPGFYYRGIYLILHSKRGYGPFEFQTGGTAAFLKSLSELAELTRCSDDQDRFYVRPYQESLYRSNYQLPYRMNQGFNISKSTNIGDQLTTSLRRVGQAVSRIPVNSILSNILLPGSSIAEGQYIENNKNSEDYLSKCLAEDIQNIETNRLRTTDDSDFAVVERRPDPVSLPKMPNIRRSPPLNLEMWKNHLDVDGRVTCVDKLRKIIFEGGIESDLRSLVWKYLLGYYHWENTAEENERLRAEKHREYHILKTFWKSMSYDRLVRFSVFRERKCYIDKDVPRTDRKVLFYGDDINGNLTRLSDILLTYTMYNMDFGYFQGMNDLLALILYVVKQEEDAFWCFVGLMNRLESNFDGNLNAVREQFRQLFALIELLDPAFSEYLESKNAKDMPFCFRWFLIHFKREFSYTDTMILWETIWSDHLTKNFHIFFAAAVLLLQRQIMMSRNYDANGILRHVNDLSYNIPLEFALNLATGYIHQLDQAASSVPKDVRDVLQGPSLAMSRHAPERKHGTGSEDSPSYDYSFALFNEELEDLMAVKFNSSVMIPLPTDQPINDVNVSSGTMTSAEDANLSSFSNSNAQNISSFKSYI